MRYNLTNLTATVGNILLEGRVKEYLRHWYYGHYNHLYALNEIIDKVELLDDGSLFVELNQGMKFHVPQEKEIHPYVKYANRKYLGIIASYPKACWNQLGEIFVKDRYGKDYKLKKGDVVVDAGAHIGIFSVKAAKAVEDEGMVIAIEPDEDNLRFLKRNIELNKLGNVLLVQKGVWSKQDKLRFYLSGLSASHGFLTQAAEQDSIHEIQVDTLDRILRESGVKKVYFIKMDIEGAEIEALKGMKETLRDNDVKLAIVANHRVRRKLTYKIIARQLKENGFQVKISNFIVYARKSNKALD